MRGKALLATFGITAGLFAAGSAPAWAQSSPTQTVTGQVSVAETITLSLSASSFNLSANPGDTINTGIGNGGFATTATVGSNDPNGYTLMSTLNDPASAIGFDNVSNPADMITGNEISPYTYPGAFGGATYAGNPTIQVAAATGVSAAAGDAYGLAWQFNLPASLPAGNYDGSFDIVAIGS